MFFLQTSDLLLGAIQANPLNSAIGTTISHFYGLQVSFNFFTAKPKQFPAWQVMLKIIFNIYALNEKINIIGIIFYLPLECLVDIYHLLGSHDFSY